jgi:hypothetical protein
MKTLLAVWLLVATLASAQNVSCLLSGTLRDPSGAVIPGAEIKLTAAATGFVRTTRTNSEGFFSFPDLTPSTFNVSISAPGFKNYSQNDVTINSSEQRSLGVVELQVGAATETVTVTAEAAHVMTASGERAAVLTANDLSELSVRSRDFMDAISLLPGVVDLNDTREAPSFTTMNNVFILGGRANQKNMTVDGVTNLDIGDATAVTTLPSMDSVAELKVLMSNYAAEYGRNSGGTVTVITKGGGQQFHVTAGWYHRHEGLAANTYFNNRNGIGKPRYRYNIFSYTVGGPVYIPGKFNRDRSRLFFFFSQEFQRQLVNEGSKTVTVPTALERAGDFSRSFDTNGRLITVYDAQNGQKAFPGNVIPATRFSRVGQNVLNLFPLPNFVDPDPSRRYQWNFISSMSMPSPRRTDVFRVDYSPRQNVQLFVRLGDTTEVNHPTYGSTAWNAGSVNFPLTPIQVRQPGQSAAVHNTVTLSPSLFNDFVFGVSHNTGQWAPDYPERVSRQATGITAPQWYPKNNPEGYIPNMTFGGLSNVANSNMEASGPANTYSLTYSLVENLSKVYRTHTLKGGVYSERAAKNRTPQTAIRGAFAFDRDRTNPLDTNDAYANALTGVFLSYAEATARPWGHIRFRNFEWYAQDDWRVSPRLFLNFGVRFYNDPPQYDTLNRFATFVPRLYNPSQAPVLLRPGVGSDGTKVAVNPRTGTSYPAILVGTYAPGIGDPANGTTNGGKNGFPPATFTTPAVAVAPRLGFSWDPFGKGRTVIRGGAGVFYNRSANNMFTALLGNPPNVYTPTVYFGSLDNLAQTAGQAVLAPTASSTAIAARPDQSPDTTYNYSFGVQQRIGRSMVVDVSYAGSLGRHLWWQRNINAVPVGARFLDLHPENRDLTTSSTALSPNFLRPYQGWGDILATEMGATSTYNALQVGTSHRTSRGTLSVGYSFSKVLGTASAYNTAVSPFFDPRTRNYGPLTYDRTHVLTVQYNYRLPQPGRHFRLPWMGTVTDHWEISGVTRIMSGAPFTPSFSTVDGQDITGTPSESARPDVVDPNADPVRRFGRPARGSFGNAGTNVLRGPGMNNWDISVYRRIPIREGGKYIQLRFESYNTFNHTQFSAVSQAARFDLQGNQTDPLFLQPTAARNPRRVQLAMRFNW